MEPLNMYNIHILNFVMNFKFKYVWKNKNKKTNKSIIVLDKKGYMYQVNIFLIFCTKKQQQTYVVGTH